MSDLNKEIKRLSNLRNYKHMDLAVIEKIAQTTVWKNQLNLKSRFTDKKEQDRAEKLFDDYLQNYEFKTFSDVNTLSDLIYEEILKSRVQDTINNISADKSNKYVSDKQISSLHSIEDRIITLKERLGIIGTKEQDDLSALEMLKKRFEVFIPLNRNEFTCYLPSRCKKCGTEDVHPILMRRRVKDFDVLKHPFLSGRFLWNTPIMQDVESGELTKEKAAEYLATSTYYIDWALEHKNEILSLSGISQEEMDEILKKIPYLPNPNKK